MVEIVRAETFKDSFGTEWVVERNTRYAKSQWTEHPDWFLGTHCLECGFENPSIHYGGGYKEQMLERQLCFTCNHWTNYINRTDTLNPDRTRLCVDGNVYSFKTNKPWVDKAKYGDFLGFGGRTWWIYFPSSDTRIKTNDLWHGGEVPEAFRDRIKDNAEFLHVNSDGSYSHEWQDKY